MPDLWLSVLSQVGVASAAETVGPPRCAPQIESVIAMNQSAILPLQGSRHLLAVDTSDFIRRAWHGWVNERRNEPARVAPSAIRAIAKPLRGQQPSHVLCATEGLGSIRKQMFAEYKGNRPPKPDGLLFCEGQVATALRSAWIPLHSHAGLEADDVIHGAVLVAKQVALPVVIASRDKDLECLAHAESRVVILSGDVALDEAAVRAKWGVEPRHIPDILALSGDTADNIPHVRGWGPAAAKRILGSRTLADLLGPDGYWYVGDKYRKLFLDNREMIRVARELVTLRGEMVVHKLDVDEMECNALRAAASLMEIADNMGVDDNEFMGDY